MVEASHMSFRGHGSRCLLPSMKTEICGSEAEPSTEISVCLFIYVLFCHLVDAVGRFKEPCSDVFWSQPYCAIFQIMQLSDWCAQAPLHHKKDSVMYFSIPLSLNLARDSR